MEWRHNIQTPTAFGRKEMTEEEEEWYDSRAFVLQPRLLCVVSRSHAPQRSLSFCGSSTTSSTSMSLPSSAFPSAQCPTHHHLTDIMTEVTYDVTSSSMLWCMMPFWWSSFGWRWKRSFPPHWCRRRLPPQCSKWSFSEVDVGLFCQSSLCFGCIDTNRVEGDWIQVWSYD